jgi:hypothetical protein
MDIAYGSEKQLMILRLFLQRYPGEASNEGIDGAACGFISCDGALDG